jgi:hypothetical protein
MLPLNLLNEYTIFAIGTIALLAVGVLIWRGVRRIELRLDTLRAEVSALSAVEQRNFLIALRSSDVSGEAHSLVESEPSIVPELADGQSGDANSAAAESGADAPANRRGRGDRRRNAGGEAEKPMIFFG